MKEEDLYPPLREFLEAQGYTVRAEVHGCDCTATKGDALVVVEMKLRLNLDLILQGVERQRMTPSVYLAIPRKAVGQGKRWRAMRRLLRRLELGLIAIAPEAPVHPVQVVFHPKPYQRRQRKQARLALLEEAAHRSTDGNMGGSTGRKLLTAYREQAIRIACFLETQGPQSPKHLRARGCGPKTAAILYANYYGWFERIERGVYGITSAGRKGVEDYPELASVFRAEAEETREEENRTEGT